MADEGIRIPASQLDSIIKSADGTTALLYLYVLRDGGTLSERAAARELRRTEAEIRTAAAKLREMGVACASGPAAVHLPQPEEVPEYSAEDIAGRCKTDSVFQAIVDEAQKKLGRILSGADLRILFGIYDYLALPPEVILLLINYCMDRFREKYGPGRVPSMRTIEKEAYAWVNREILTLEQAEEHIEYMRRRSDTLRRLKDAIQIRDRELTASERKYAESWLDMGFGIPALTVAYDRTVTQTGSLKWAYMNKIVLSWHQKGLHTVEEIEKGDGRRMTKKPVSGAGRQSAPTNADVERMRRMLEKMESGK